MIAAIVPAAGHSTRMGRPKLILPLGGGTLIARVVSALRAGGAAVVVVVAPRPETAGADALARQAIDAGAVVVAPEVQPPDMRASFECGLAFLDGREAVVATVLLAPGDSPGITAALVKRVLEQALVNPSRIVVPTHAGQRGHPIALPWARAREVRDLPAGVGINALVAARPELVVELVADDPGVVADLDTPEDYARWSNRAL